MTYYCDVHQEGEKMYIAQFPDMTNVITYGYTLDHSLLMAKEALEGILAVDLDYNLEIPEPQYTGGYPVEVSADLAERIRARDPVSA